MRNEEDQFPFELEGIIKLLVTQLLAVVNYKTLQNINKRFTIL